MQRAILLLVLVLFGGPAFAQQPPAVTQELTPLPGNSISVYYKQPIYDSSGSNVGEVEDILLDRDGHVVALIVSIGGFAGIGEKHVAVPFGNVIANQRENKWRLVMSTSTEALKAAQGFKYDKSKLQWIPQPQK